MSMLALVSAVVMPQWVLLEQTHVYCRAGHHVAYLSHNTHMLHTPTLHISLQTTNNSMCLPPTLWQDTKVACTANSSNSNQPNKATSYEVWDRPFGPFSHSCVYNALPGYNTETIQNGNCAYPNGFPLLAGRFEEAILTFATSSNSLCPSNILLEGYWLIFLRW